MPIYQFKCRACEATVDTFSHPDARDEMLGVPCGDCGATVKRIFRFSAPAEFVPHHSATTGTWVESAGDFKSQLKAASLKAEERTGVKHNFVPVGGSDIKHTLTDDGMKATHDLAVAKKEIEPSRKVFS